MPSSNDNSRPRTPAERRGAAAAAAAAAAQREAIRAKARRRIAIAAAVGVVVAIVAVVAVVASLGGSHKSAASADTAAKSSLNSSSAASGAVSGTCTYSPAGQAAKNVGRPPATGFAHVSYKATLTTSQGVVSVDLAGDKAPCTVNSFVYLATHKYFDGTNCHRLTTSGIFVLQCGDPTGTGTGGPGYQFADENLAGATYPAGTVAMANAGPGTNGSQFFLVYKDTQLPPNFTPFGTITSGLDVLNAIAAKGSDNGNGPGDGKPTVPVRIESLTVASGS